VINLKIKLIVDRDKNVRKLNCNCFFLFLEFKKAVKLVVETVHFDKSNVVQVISVTFSIQIIKIEE